MGADGRSKRAELAGICRRERCLEKQAYLNRPNLEYIEGFYRAFLKEPQTVEGEWQRFSKALNSPKIYKPQRGFQPRSSTSIG